MPFDGRPRFARDFPRAPVLDALVDAFARGDYARVRAEGRVLAASAQQADDVRSAARLLVSRTEPDPQAVWLLVMTGALLVVLSAYWIAHGTPPAGIAPVVPTPSST